MICIALVALCDMGYLASLGNFESFCNLWVSNGRLLIKRVVWLPGFDTLPTEPRARQVYPATCILSVITGRCPGQVQGSSVRLYIPPYFRNVVGQ